MLHNFLQCLCFAYQIEADLDFVEASLLVEVQQVAAILLVYVLASGLEPDGVQRRVLLLDLLESALESSYWLYISLSHAHLREIIFGWFYWSMISWMKR